MTRSKSESSTCDMSFSGTNGTTEEVPGERYRRKRKIIKVSPLETSF